MSELKNFGRAGQGQVRVLLGQDDLSMTDYKIAVSFLFNSAKFYHRTRFQITLPVHSQNVIKNRTDHRMHVGGIQICQITGWNKSFQNMYSMNRQKLTIRPGKSILCKKNTSKAAFFVCTNLNYWKLWGITLQTSYVEGRWHQNRAHRSPLHFFIECARKFEKKWFFWVKRSVLENFLLLSSTHGILTHSGFRKCNCFGWPSLSFEVTAAQNVVIGQKLEVLQKIRGVTKN